MLRASLLLTLACVCGTTAGRGMNVHRNAGVMNQHQIADIDSITYGTAGTPSMTIHSGADERRVDLVDIDSMTFRPTDAPYTIYPTGNLSYTAVRGELKNMNLSNTSWGPSWRWFSFSGTPSIGPDGERLFVATRDLPGTTANITMRHKAYAVDNHTLAVEWRLSVDADA
ncbi:MAG: hypothetical protein GF331_07610, partial [Chitinivibrionales bacterium]|nr:hypothetical protein [Chitinivibrionales bacterium]